VPELRVPEVRVTAGADSSGVTTVAVTTLGVMAVGGAPTAVMVEARGAEGAEGAERAEVRGGVARTTEAPRPAAGRAGSHSRSAGTSVRPVGSVEG
jgi:hypothetical protein